MPVMTVMMAKMGVSVAYVGMSHTSAMPVMTVMMAKMGVSVAYVGMSVASGVRV
jgi:hypothetical protein